MNPTTDVTIGRAPAHGRPRGEDLGARHSAGVQATALRTAATFRLPIGFALGGTPPTGTGGGIKPDERAARSGMDDAMFAVDLTAA